MTESNTFLTAATLLALAGCLGAAVSPVIAGASAAYTGSITTSGVLGVVFAGRSVQLFRETGAVSLPGAVLTTIFGGWFMAAPLLYDAGFLATAGTQLAGTLVATFGLYAVVAGVTDSPA
ncbi:MAG: hypothetical protein J07HN6_02552 [Halonotius sp. J07HN6]|jgi:hypothetical protein|nr:MAG: hypothetical protein J07HN6_02552 [Halonotius sp. J07HN6]ESS07984.1 MAG: hypothetical protein A07HN63_02002 [uncultured archaeon A07HN63]